MTGAWQVIAACRYNLRHLTALRIIVVSTAALCILPLCTLPLLRETAYWKLLVGAYGSLFLYGSLTLLALLFSESLPARLTVPAFWLVAWVVLVTAIEPRQQEYLLANIPLEFCCAFAAAALLVYLLELRLLIMRTRRIVYAFHS